MKRMTEPPMEKLSKKAVKPTKDSDSDHNEERKDTILPLIQDKNI
jgi:hypothetical protein